MKSMADPTPAARGTPRHRLRSVRAALAVCALTLAACAATSGTSPPWATAAGVVHSCPKSSTTDYPVFVRILSVRFMTCSQALAVYHDNKGWEHVPVAKNVKARIGPYTCRVYRDLTLPGPSDSDVLIRCVHGSKAFRFEYAV
jgi:hypothetical protein